MSKSYTDGYQTRNLYSPTHPADEELQNSRPYSAELKKVISSPLNNKKAILLILVATLISVSFSFSLVDSFSSTKTLQLIILMIPIFVVMYFSIAHNEALQELKKLDKKYADLHQQSDRELYGSSQK
jgi:hypothetical protein